MSDGFFRSKQGFTVVQNNISRDKTISMKAKGLYLIIQSYITMPDVKWLKSSFMNMVPEGEKAFNSAWKELKEKGYLKVHIISHGTDFSNEYELLDEPHIGPHTFYYNSKGEVTKTIGGGDMQVKKETTNPAVDNNFRYSQNGHVGNGHVGKGSVGFGHVEKGDDNNNTLLNNPSEDKSLNITPSFIRAPEEEGPEDKSLQDERKNEQSTDVVLDINKKLLPGDSELILDEIKHSCGIPYEYAFDVKDMTIAIQSLSQWNNHETAYGSGNFEKETYRLVVESLVEMATSRKPIDIKGVKISYKNVIDRINAFYDESDQPESALFFVVKSVIDRFRAATEDKVIRNHKGYIKSILWEAFGVCKVDWENYFNYTYYGGLKRKDQDNFGST